MSGFGLFSLGFALWGVVAFNVDKCHVAVGPENLEVGEVAHSSSDVEAWLSEKTDYFACFLEQAEFVVEFGFSF